MNITVESDIKLNRVSTVDAVASDIRRRVLEGEFPLGSQLREASLIENYGVARHCIRSALHSLAHEGLLRHHANRGVFVPDADPEDLSDVLYMRRVFELEALRFVIERSAPTNGIVAALAAIEALPAGASRSDMLAVDLGLHEALVHAVGSARMTRLHEALLDELRLFLVLVPDTDEHDRVGRHRDLVNAILAKDLVRARELLIEDFAKSPLVVDA